jgi:NAD(P)-dependent dehydrogenase (short-subunit alcohol dehydrogenase family)
MDEKALVLGVGTNNIGAAVDNELQQFIESDPLFIHGEHNIPTIMEMYEGNYQHLVICCGFMKIERFDRFSTDDIYKVIKANLTTPLLAIRNFLKAGPAPQPGRASCVIVIGSYAHDHVLSNSVPYCAAKAGINHAIKCLAWDYTGAGYRFHCVNPHSVEDTPMTQDVIKEIRATKNLTEGEALAYWNRTKVLPNRLTRDEVAKTVAWLIKGPTDHLSGTSIELYGGER